MYSVWHNFPFILLFQKLATSVGLSRPSSGQYLQKIKNAAAYSITRQFHAMFILYAPAFLNFCNYWPDDGLFRPKPVASDWNNKIERKMYQTQYMFYFWCVADRAS